MVIGSHLHELVHVLFDAVLGHVVSATADEFVDIHVHELEDEGETTRGLVVENLQEPDDIGVGGETAEGLWEGEGGERGGEARESREVGNGQPGTAMQENVTWISRRLLTWSRDSK